MGKEKIHSHYLLTFFDVKELAAALGYTHSNYRTLPREKKMLENWLTRSTRSNQGQRICHKQLLVFPKKTTRDQANIKFSRSYGIFCTSMKVRRVHKVAKSGAKTAVRKPTVQLINSALAPCIGTSEGEYKHLTSLFCYHLFFLRLSIRQG